MELMDVFQAYYDCRKNKRNTANAIKFELDYERKLIDLYDEIISGKYEIGKSIAFIILHPVKREVFAGDFRDRIIHHLLINKLNPIFEKLFIHDSYSCREGKGTLFGIKRIDSFIRSATENYQKDAYILKLDIAGFFMNIDKNILFRNLESLTTNLGLSLHERKIYFQHYSKGVSFLGAYIKPYRIYVGKRIKGGFYEAIEEINRMVAENESILRDKSTQKLLLSKINSYLGLMQHYDSFTLRKKILFLLDASFWNHFYISERYRLVVAKTREYDY